MQTIAKHCADHLRAFADSHGVKLKPTHAHELVAAFCGYKSKAAMQDDALYPAENLARASVLVLMPSVFIEQRRQCLENLPADLPDTYALGEELFSYLIPEALFSGRSFASYQHLAEVLIDEYLQEHGSLILPERFGMRAKVREVFKKPLYEVKPKIEISDSGVNLVVTNRYYGPSDLDFPSIDVTVMIKLRRVAGHVGYTIADISGTCDPSAFLDASGTNREASRHA